MSRKKVIARSYPAYHRAIFFAAPPGQAAAGVHDAQRPEDQVGVGKLDGSAGVEPKKRRPGDQRVVEQARVLRCCEGWPPTHASLTERRRNEAEGNERPALTVQMAPNTRNPIKIPATEAGTEKVSFGVAGCTKPNLRASLPATSTQAADA